MNTEFKVGDMVIPIGTDFPDMPWEVVAITPEHIIIYNGMGAIALLISELLPYFDKRKEAANKIKSLINRSLSPDTTAYLILYAFEKGEIEYEKK